MKKMREFEGFSMIEELLDAVSEVDNLLPYGARKLNTKNMRAVLETQEPYEVVFASKILPILEKNKALSFPLDFLFEEAEFIYKKTDANGRADFLQMVSEAEIPFMLVRKPSDLNKVKKWLTREAKSPKYCHYMWY